MIGADPAAWGDVIVGRKETPTSYHLVGRASTTRCRA